MTVLTIRTRAWLRRNGRAAAVAALGLGIVAGLVIGLATGARRTGSAPDRYTEAAGGDDGNVLLYQPGGAPLTDAISELPGVADIGAITFVLAFPSPGDGQEPIDADSFAGDDTLRGARVVSGRFTDPTAPDEFTVNRTMASQHGLRPGQVFQVFAFDQAQTQENDFLDRPAVTPFQATLVGIVESPGDFDEPTASIAYSKAFLNAHPTVGRVATLNVVRLEPGADVDHLMDAVRALPDGGDIHVEEAPIVSGNARRAVRLQATALWLVVAVAVVAAAAVTGVLASRIVGPTEPERASLSALGSTSTRIQAEVAAEAAIVVAMATPIAAVVGFAASAAFPIGALELLEPAPGPRFDWLVIAIGVAALFGATAVAAMVAVRRRAAALPTRSRPVVSRLAVTSSVPLTVGAHLAANGGTVPRSGLRRATLGTVGVAGLVASLIVGTSMVAIGDDGSRWGAHYDEIFGNQFTPTATDLAALVVDDPDLSAVAAATFEFVTIDGRSLSVFGTETLRGALDPVVLAGRVPSGPDEIALGAVVARESNVGIGQTVEASADDGTIRSLAVVGIAVSPGEAGDGAVMSYEGLAGLRPEATKNLLMVRVRDGAPEDTLDRIADSLSTLRAAVGVPTSVASLERVIPAPFLLAAVLAALLMITFLYLLAMTVRSRRGDFAVLRALGATRSQLQGAIHWHATIAAGTAIMIGVPIGIVAGRQIVSLITDALGIVPGASVPVVPTIAASVAVVVLANVLGAWPAIRGAGTARRVTLTRHG